MGAPKYKWTSELDTELRYLATRMNGRAISKVIGIGEDTVWRRLRKLGIAPLNQAEVCEPPQDLWIRVATTAAQRHNVNPSKLMAGRAQRRICKARREAWSEILLAYPQYSISGLGRVSGFNRSTIITGLRRLGVHSQLKEMRA